MGPSTLSDSSGVEVPVKFLEDWLKTGSMRNGNDGATEKHRAATATTPWRNLVLVPTRGCNLS